MEGVILEGVGAFIQKEGGRVETNEPRKETKETLQPAQLIRPSQTEGGQVGHHRLLHGQGQRGWVWGLDTPYRMLQR